MSTYTLEGGLLIDDCEVAMVCLDTVSSCPSAWIEGFGEEILLHEEANKTINKWNMCTLYIQIIQIPD